MANTVTASVLGERGPRVHYSFESSSDEVVVWHIESIDVDEGLSVPYAISLQLASADPTADAATLLGHDCTIEMRRDTRARRFVGVADEVCTTGMRDGYITARVRVVPALRALELSQESRIFQGKAVPEILDEVLGAALKPYGRTVQLRLSGTYSKLEYVVQYHESDSNFVHRLMQHEGIVYFFDHGDAVEQLVLVDDVAEYPKVDTDEGDRVPFEMRRGEGRKVEVVHQFELSTRWMPTKAMVRSYNWTRPTVVVDEPSGGGDEQERTRAIYEARVAVLTDYDGEKYQGQDAANQAKLIDQQHAMSAQVFTGRGRVTSFAPGSTFELTKHDDFSARYLITRVGHLGDASEGGDAAADPAETYSNRFECIPIDVPFRPRRWHPKPRIHGAQTAVVVGSGSDDVYTDVHGRVRVRFSWDKGEAEPGKDSCYLRVLQAWAGSGYGHLFIPRVGMEVLVTFIDGDPDCPVITGCLHNGDHKPPQTLAAEKTRSTIRTATLPGGIDAGFNELSFEDAKGNEEVYVRAQRNMRSEVRNDHDSHVMNKEKLKVDVDRERTVGNNETVTVGASQTVTVGQNSTLNVGVNATQIVGGAMSVAVAAAHSLAAGSSSEAVGSKSVSAGGAVSISAGGDMNQKADGNFAVEATGEVALKSGDKTTLTVGGDLTVDGKGVAQVEAASRVEVLCGSAKVTVTSGGDITIDGGKVTIKGGSQVTVKGATIALN